ncbi:MAG: allophanate hydrolase [Gammaproteobacteria bacterium]|nr:allophanate hydrolase [Gammaproteobacteria bacterium]
MRNLSIPHLRQAYLSGARTPEQVLAEIDQANAAYPEHNIWIHYLSAAERAPYLERLAHLDPAEHPLWGVPFAIKDNIDLAGVDTTAGCEAFRYRPERSACVVQRLLDAGAIPLGKTNLDQFATGLVGTRSPWGATRNAFDPEHISGGSSSGSAVAVALGLASFSLGTDTAGSGRVPAAFNNLVGVKPSRGLLSASGMLPACRSLDCMSIFALHCDDAALVLGIAEGQDSADAYSRPNPYSNSPRHYGDWQDRLVLGVIPPDQLEFFGAADFAQAYQASLDAIRPLVDEIIEIDFQPFAEAAALLYQGPWVAERYLATQPLIDTQAEALLPVTRQIISAGAKPSAAELFRAQYRLQALKQLADNQLARCNCLLTPTAGRHFRIDEIAAEPILHNSQLGHYTNFMNLLDLAAVALPGRFTAEAMPFGLTLAGPAFSDRKLLSIARRIEQALDQPKGALGLQLMQADLAPVRDAEHIDLVVCGAHMQGLPLNWQLRERGGELLVRSQTAPCYRLYALAGGPPARPGLVRDDVGGRAIEAEIWRLPASELGSFLAAIPPPLGLGKVLMADGKEYTGFICEPRGIAEAEEISQHGGWRTWLNRSA